MTEYTRYNNAFVPPAIGFENTGYICWLNSLVQSFLSCSALNQIMLRDEDHLKNNKLAQSYLNLLRRFKIGTTTSSPPTISAADISRSTREIHHCLLDLHVKSSRNIFGVQQECVQEALVHFIDLFNHAPIKNLFKIRYQKVYRCASCNKITKYPPIESYNVEYFEDPNMTHTEEEFLKRLKCFPSVADKSKCEKCGVEKTGGIHYELLSMVREVIIVMFKNKFLGKTPSWFPPELHFTSQDESGNERTLTYKAVSKIDHSGGLNGGHYWAVCRRGEKTYALNDTSVGEEPLIGQPNTFLVFYHLC